MSSSEFNIPEMAPCLDHDGLPDSEKNGAYLVEANLSNLDSHVRDMQTALRLFDFTSANQAGARQQPYENKQAQAFLEISSGWQMVAARDGAMTIYHFATALAGIRETVSASPTLYGLVDMLKLKAANQLLHKRFPNFGDVRNAVAHVADKMKTPSKYDEHSFSGSMNNAAIKADNISGLTISNMLMDRKYANTWNGKLLEYEISGETVASLNEIKSEVWSIFRSVEHELHRRGMIARSAAQTPSTPPAPLT